MTGVEVTILGVLLCYASVIVACAVLPGMIVRPEGRRVVIAGVPIHYVDCGSGPPVILVHGLNGQSRHFTYALAGLLQSEFRVIVLDRPGSGFSGGLPSGPQRLGHQAEIILALATKLGLVSPVVVGHSLGGTLALIAALKSRDHIGGIVLIAPLVALQDRAPGSLRALAIASPVLRSIVAWTIAPLLALFRARRVGRAVFAPDPRPLDFAVQGGGLLSLRPKSFYAASSDIIAAHHEIPELAAATAQLSMPVACLFGAGDAVIEPRAQMRTLQLALPHVKCELLPGAGHMLPVTHPEICADAIRQVAKRMLRQPVEDGDVGRLPQQPVEVACVSR